jgi:Uma2 family endonuclease
MGVVTTLPQSRPLTETDLQSIREADDGHRYELIDGALIVTPAPRVAHQHVVAEMLVRLRTAAPPGVRVYTSPLDLRLRADTVMQPDLLVARREDFTETNLPVAPLLAVEVLSPSTRHIDLALKRARLETAGCASYWVVDPDQPSLTAWDLVDGSYRQVADVSGSEGAELTRPFPIRVVPSDLLDT